MKTGIEKFKNVGIVGQDLGTEAHPRGVELLQEVANLTGLPDAWVNGQLETILDRAGKEKSGLTLEDLRGALLHYLEGLALEGEGLTSKEESKIH
jgi:hypothetical protein